MEVTVEMLTKYGAETQAINERFMNDMELYNSCMEKYLADTCVFDLGKAIESGEYKKAFEAAHSLKGTTGNMGLTPMYKAVCEIVEALRAEKCGELTQQYKKVCEEFDKVKQMLE